MLHTLLLSYIVKGKPGRSRQFIGKDCNLRFEQKCSCVECHFSWRPKIFIYSSTVTCKNLGDFGWLGFGVRAEKNELNKTTYAIKKHLPIFQYETQFSLV